jgi:hypothetical protein
MGKTRKLLQLKYFDFTRLYMHLPRFKYLILESEEINRVAVAFHFAVTLRAEGLSHRILIATNEI